MIFDTDAHVEECLETFAGVASDPRWAKQAPAIVEGQGRAFWHIEGYIHPKIAGRGVYTFGTPHKQGAGDDPARKASRASQELTTPQARLEDMDREGIDVSVNFPTLFLVYPVADNPAYLEALVRSYNDWIAAKSAGSGGRLRWVAALPWPTVAAATAELRRVKDKGACGVLILGTVSHMTLDDPALDPFYAEAERLRMPVCVHVGFSYPPLSQLYSSLYQALAAPFVLPTFMAFTAMIGGGVLDRFPKLRVGFFEAGIEWVPYWLDRLERFYRQPPGGSRDVGLPQRPPTDYLKSGNVFFSCELDERKIAAVAEDIGEDCIVYASDLPHAHRVFNAVELFRQRSDVPPKLKEKILGVNGRRFYEDV